MTDRAMDLLVALRGLVPDIIAMDYCLRSPRPIKAVEDLVRAGYVASQGFHRLLLEAIRRALNVGAYIEAGLRALTED